MSNRIEKLTLCGFRGATCPVEISFNAKKPIVMIFGENGNGKSTIVDAVDFVCNRLYGSISDRSSTSPKSHLPALGKLAKDVEIQLTFGGRTWTARVGTKGPVTLGPDGCPTAVILRRHQVLSVVNEQPKERYKALQRFITVAQIERAEQSLRDAVRAAGRDLDEAARAKQQAQEALERLWAEEGRPGPGCEEWARELTANSSAGLQASAELARVLLRALDSAVSARERVGTEEEAHARRSRAQDAAWHELQASAAAGVERQAALIDLLKHTQLYLDAHDAAPECPVCLRDLDAGELRGRVAERLAEMREAVELKEKAEAAARGAAASAAVLAGARETLVQEARKLFSLLRVSEFKEVRRLAVKWSNFSRLGEEIGGEADLASLEEATAFLALVEPCRGPLAARHDADTKALNQLTAVRANLDTLDEKTAAAVDFDRINKRLKAMLAVVERRRKEYVAAILEEISGTVEELYRKLHPDEPVGNCRFFLRDKVIGSLEFEGQFETAAEVPPQAYYSESHLDTLGICVFLAMVKHSDPANSIVVLDDVVTSVDNSHLRRFIDMLQDVAGDFGQLIITTHYRHWRDQFKRNNSSNVQFIELSKWTLRDGLRPAETKLDIDELRGLLEQGPLPRRDVAIRAGVFLEQILDSLALHYRFKVPRLAEPNYDLGVLTDAAMKASKHIHTLVLTEGSAGEPTQFKPLLDAVKPLTRIRNEVGAHHNEAGAEWSDDDVRRFGETTLKIAEALLCGGCGELPAHNKTGLFWQCRCGGLRMNPFEIP